MLAKKLHINNETFYGESKHKFTKVTLRASELKSQKKNWPSLILFQVHISDGNGQQLDIVAEDEAICAHRCGIIAR